jgi:hypothetical protein
MVDLGKVGGGPGSPRAAHVTGPAGDWLAGRRAELNRRFERARRRFPGLDGDAVLDLLAELLPPLGGDEPGAATLLSSVYDLVLLHAGRDAFGARPGLGVLLRHTFRVPAMRTLLLARPGNLPAALSNAVESMGSRGVEFARQLGSLAPALNTPDALLGAGALVAWRLGEARLRASALEQGDRLPPRAVLLALELDDWPVESAPLALASLRGDAWCSPRRRIKEATLAALPGAAPEHVTALAGHLATKGANPAANWRLVARVGDFAGFGGSFEAPPLVADAGGRHQLFARSGEQDFVIDADLFGWTCRPGTRDEQVEIRTPRPVSHGRSLKRMLLGQGPGLEPDGSFAAGERRVTLSALAGASSFTLRPALVAATRPDSYRIRIAVPEPEPL